MEKSKKKRVVKRLRIIKGQVEGLERMIEEDIYCVDILYQSLAAKEALSSFEDFILENHLETHVAEQIASREKEKAIREIMTVYKLSKRK